MENFLNFVFLGLELDRETAGRCFYLYMAIIAVLVVLFLPYKAEVKNLSRTLHLCQSHWQDQEQNEEIVHWLIVLPL